MYSKLASALLAIGLVAGPANEGRAQTTVFPGGSLDDLRSLSPNLQFGRLVIDGALTIDLSSDAPPHDLRLVAEDLTITANGRIGSTQSACSYQDSPSLEIIAGNRVVIDGAIDLEGKSGDRTSTASSCNQCDGRDGGDISIRASEILVNDALISDGGWGSSDQFIQGGVVFSFGCAGGDAGQIRLEAGSRLHWQQPGADFLLRGGRGGTGNRVGSDGSDGADGIVRWLTPDVDVDEIEPNASKAGAQLLPAVPLVISGSISATDDAGETNGVSITFPPSNTTDFVEDLYELVVDQPGTIDLQLAAANPQTDVDLYLIQLGLPNPLLAQSNQAGGTEGIAFGVSPGHYLVGVSWCCNTPSSTYTLSIGPQTLAAQPPPPGLVEEDLLVPGDGLLSRDSATQLEWLDLGVTANLSYEAVRAGAGGWKALGFRHATRDEVCGLFSSFSFAQRPCIFAATASADAVSRLQEMLGWTTLATDLAESRGIYDDGADAGGAGEALLALASGSSTAELNGNSVATNATDGAVGDFLVRAVPEPAAAASELAGLATLMALAMRRRRRRP